MDDRFGATQCAPSLSFDQVRPGNGVVVETCVLWVSAKYVRDGFVTTCCDPRLHCRVELAVTISLLENADAIARTVCECH